MGGESLALDSTLERVQKAGLIAAMEGRQRAYAYVPIGRGRELWELCGLTASFVKQVAHGGEGDSLEI